MKSEFFFFFKCKGHRAGESVFVIRAQITNSRKFSNVSINVSVQNIYIVFLNIFSLNCSYCAVHEWLITSETLSSSNTQSLRSEEDVTTQSDRVLSISSDPEHTQWWKVQHSSGWCTTAMPALLPRDKRASVTWGKLFKSLSILKIRSLGRTLKDTNVHLYKQIKNKDRRKIAVPSLCISSWGHRQPFLTVYITYPTPAPIIKSSAWPHNRWARDTVAWRPTWSDVLLPEVGGRGGGWVGGSLTVKLKTGKPPRAKQ